MTKNPDINSTAGELLTSAGFDRDAVDRLIASAPDDVPTRPALTKLSQDQRDLLGDFIDGFPDRASFVTWTARAVVQTLGEIPDDWYLSRAFSPGDLSVLVVGPGRDRWTDTEAESLSAEKAAACRRGIVSLDLLPAFRDAYRSVRWNATEYIQDEYDSLQPDADVQENPAMRPALGLLGDRQSWTLRTCLDGFESVDALVTWSHMLTDATAGEIDETLARDLYSDRATRRMLVTHPNDVPGGPFFRESFAAKFLIPAFNAAARELAERAGELAESETTGLEATKL